MMLRVVSQREVLKSGYRWVDGFVEGCLLLYLASYKCNLLNMHEGWITVRGTHLSHQTLLADLRSTCTVGHGCDP